ncbi:MAG: tRNA (N6-threonylcarbamoyladenosine(37)-N6)-methyltransferase TrmO [Lachnospiraceae bacterium]|nr:tRNA (N6-threonylcarbamoyladenosine(37)-N6)-methyltransferase TrmO [Lachnospiraceae bacterium]
MKIIARIETDFKEKFGIPRQSGLVPEAGGRIVFEKEYRDPNALKGLDAYSHIWLLWEFSKAIRENWSPTVLPPRLGGNTHMGVFATRSPFRPNPIGLSCVKLERIDREDPQGPVLYVSGVDLLDGTPIYDIKPYLSYTDSHPEAVCGFADDVKDYELEVTFPEELLNILPENKRAAAIAILRQDPRPSYQDDPSRRYGTAFAGYDIRFYVEGRQLRVAEVEKL